MEMPTPHIWRFVGKVRSGLYLIGSKKRGEGMDVVMWLCDDVTYDENMQRQGPPA